MNVSFFRNRYVRRSKFICYLIFGFFPSPKNRLTLWDNTSLVLKKAVNKWIEDDMSVLEIGTGDVGLLSNYLERKKSVEITAIDICADFIENSERNRKKNSKINFIESDLFINLNPQKKYDVIFSNPPYVSSSRINPEHHAQYHGFSKKEMLFYASDGGENGTDMIKRIIIESSSYVDPDGSLLIGYNQNHIGNETLDELIAVSEFAIFDKLYTKYNNCVVINLKKK